MQKRTRLLLVIFLPIQLVFLQIIKYFPSFIETYYSNGLYPLLSKVSRYLFGWIPFSIGDLFYLGIGLLAIRWLYKNKGRLRYDIKNFILVIVATLSVVYFTFNMLWGLNYYREPLHTSLDIKTEYSTEQLISITKRFIEKSNEMHNQLGYADSTKIDLPYSHQEIFSKSINGYQNVTSSYPFLKYEPLSIKNSTWSLVLTYMGYSGYFNPFSGEAQVNKKIKSYRFPVVSCHEQAHQIGYARENEANFLAALATINNEDPYIQYTGYIFVLRYCINEIARRDIDTYRSLLETIHPGILKSYKEMRDFWKSYENPFEVLSKVFWNQFLKANNQSKGIMSYSYMVALVVNYYEDKEL